MAIPATARVFRRVVDPKDIIEFAVIFSRGDDDDDILQVGENITAFTLERGLEAVTAGLQIMDDDDYFPFLGLNPEGDTVLVFWATVQADKQTSAIFDRETPMPVEGTFTTDHVPPRVKQRTFVIIGWNQ